MIGLRPDDSRRNGLRGTRLRAFGGRPGKLPSSVSNNLPQSVGTEEFRRSCDNSGLSPFCWRGRSPLVAPIPPETR